MDRAEPTSTNPFIPPLPFGLRLNLSIMMFLQFAIWGSWFVVFFPYLKKVGFSDNEASDIFANMALGAIFSTMFAGYIADRFFSSERLMAVLHLIGAGLLYWMAQIQDPSQYWLMYFVSLLYALLYNPTLALSNSIAFTHIPDATRDFPSIRVLGTFGWIAVGFLIDTPLITGGAPSAADTNRPLILAALLSAALGVYSFFLPHTPPTAKAGAGLPFLKALGLFKDFSFAVFFIISFVITIVLAFYYSYTGDFLGRAIGVTAIGSTMLIGQVAELILLPLLPIFLYRFGMKWVLAMGMLAWGIRYFLFSIGGPELLPFTLVILGIALHGVCFDFFFAAGFIYVDNEAPKDIRASGQALFSFLTYGVGMWLGGMTAGRIATAFTYVKFESIGGLFAASSSALGQAPLATATFLFSGQSFTAINWFGFWLVPSIGVLISLLLFIVLFRGQGKVNQSSNVPLKDAT
jgi:nucleoside transporter